MRNIKLTLEYDGTSFAGWQRQVQQPSVQAEVERAVAEVTKQHAAVLGSSRTDAGVHALGQVANFRTSSHLAARRFPAALNAYLPLSVRILDAADVAPAFHARYSATGRTYRYVVLNRPMPSAILRDYAYHVPASLDLDAIAAALHAVEGRHAFTAFRGVGSGERTTLCTVRIAEVMRRDALVIFTFEADRFLRHMVRMLVGSLLQVGSGKLAADAMQAILAGGDNRRAGPTVPAHGLFLVRVDYEGA